MDCAPVESKANTYAGSERSWSNNLPKWGVYKIDQPGLLVWPTQQTPSSSCRCSCSRSEFAIGINGIRPTLTLPRRFKKPTPPHGRIQRTMTTMQTRVDIIEEIPDMTNDHTQNFIFGHRLVHDQAKRHEHPRQVRRRKDQQPEETQSRLRIPSRPDVHQTRAQGSAQEGQG